MLVVRLIAVLLSLFPTIASAYSFSDLYRIAAPSVIVVSFEEGKDAGYGSAFHVGGGWFVTAAHVARHGALVARTQNAAAPATVRRIYTDEQPASDLAVLYVPLYADLLALDICNHSPAPGTSIAVIGYPLGIGPNPTITDGVISSYNEGGVFVSAFAAPGNSGGPALEATSGCVFGVVVANTSYDGIRVMNMNIAVTRALIVRALQEAKEVRP